MQDNAIVLDSSVIAALFFPEPYSMWAEEVVKKVDKLYTVDIAYAEVLNVAWKRISLQKQVEKEIMLGLEDAIGFINEVCSVVETKKIFREAINVAVRNNITVYDSLFIALANEKKARLATLDKQIIKKFEAKNLVIHSYQK